MVASHKSLKALGLSSWSSTGFIVVDDIGVGIGGHGLGGTMGGGGKVGEQKANRRDR